jgi:hypothetical protein
VWRPVGFAALVGIAIAAAAAPAPAAREPVDHAPPPPPRVTLISDSVAEALLWHPDAREYLADGLDLRIEGWACRKLITPGCFAYGGNAPSTLDTIRTLGSELGPVAVVDVGYNDSPDEYAAGFDQVMQALVDAHVQRVIWVTLSEHEDPWVQSNAVIRAGPTRWPQLAVADWGPVADGHPDWFVDLAHLNGDGLNGFARVLRPIVLGALSDCGRACEG